MGAKAYVLIEAASGHINSIIESLRVIPEVVQCDAVTGQYDVIARIESEDVNTIGRISYSKIQMIEGVRRTITCHIVDLG